MASFTKSTAGATSTPFSWAGTAGQALRIMLEAIRAMRGAGYTQEDVHELASEAWDRNSSDLVR